MRSTIWGIEPRPFANASAEATMNVPYRPIPMPQPIATAVRSASCRRERAADPGRQRRQAEPAEGIRHADVAARERHDADAEEHRGRDGQERRPTASR